MNPDVVPDVGYHSEVDGERVEPPEEFRRAGTSGQGRYFQDFTVTFKISPEEVSFPRHDQGFHPTFPRDELHSSYEGRRYVSQFSNGQLGSSGYLVYYCWLRYPKLV